MNGYRIGCDVGGTFTDLICVTPAGEVVLDKTPTTLDDQSIGVMNGMRQLAERFGLSLEEFCHQLEIVVHGTTTADNTMIEMNGAPTGLLVTRGHRDEIEMRRVHKEEIWDPSYPAPEPIARRRVRIPIPERCAYDGEVLQELDEDAVRAGIRRLRQFGCTSIAVMYLFSFVNPAHERRTLELIREEYPEVEHVSLSHEVMSAGPEFERVSTTLVNAYVAPKIARYTSHLVESLRSAGFAGSVLIMQATGGVMPPDYVAKKAVTLLGSGPTGGVMGSAVAATAAGAPDFVAVDMGGTSFDICLVRGGRPEVKTDRNWRYRYYIGIPMVDVRSVGAGGGSIARVRQGALLVGPESAGSSPGPACYGRGGTHATVTDADAVLGYLPIDNFAGGRMTLDVDAARASIARDVAEPLGIEAVEAAWGIERIVNANMANATRRVLSSYGADPRDLAVIAYGGNGPLHACALATELGAARVLVPKAAPAFSALGLLVADYVVDVLRSYVVPISQVEVERLRGLMAEVADEVDKELAPAGLPEGAAHTELYVQMAYGGQNSDMSVPCPEGLSLNATGLLDLTQRFHDLHESDRGFAFRNQQPQVRGVRLIARGETTKPGHLAELGTVTDAAAAQKGSRPVYWGTEFVDTPVFDGRVLGAGASIEGPALIEEAFTVVAVAPGWRCELDVHGSYELTH
ncbi:MAG: N-methylhydantoinase [Acidimicrobiaceae bacterium]|jgi:N-methylhydantoinase A